MSNTVRGSIRKITLGPNPRDAKAVSVGGPGGMDGTVTQILRDANYFIQTGKEKFLVFIKNKSGVEHIWNEIIDIPVVIEYSDPKSEPINKV